MLTDQAILQHIERQPHHSAGFKQLVRELGINEPNVSYIREIRRILGWNAA